MWVLSVWGSLPMTLLELRLRSALEFLPRIIHKTSQILIWVRLRWCPVGSTSLVILCVCHLWTEQNHMLVSRHSLAQGVSGGGEVKNSCYFIGESSSGVYEYEMRPARGEVIRSLVMSGHDLFRSQKPWDNQGTCGTRHESGLQADL